MKRYRIPIQEEVRLWQNINVVIETDDCVEKIYSHIRNGDLIYQYDIDDWQDHDYMLDTEEHLQYDYGHTQKSDIEEL